MVELDAKELYIGIWYPDEKNLNEFIVTTFLDFPCYCSDSVMTFERFDCYTPWPRKEGNLLW